MRWGATLAERIEHHSMPEPNSGCWLWTGALSKSGYGHIGMRNPKTTKLAHRISWLAFRGPILNEEQVLHRCDMRCCVNPDHLFIGSPSDNMKDMWTKRRHGLPTRRGETHPNRKLTEDDVRLIRASPKGTPGLAKRFGVDTSTIYAIRKGFAWKHISIDETIHGPGAR